MRWGELTGLARANTHLDTGIPQVHPDVGALYEVRGKLYLGPPKTPDSARQVHLPPFLTDLIRQVLTGHDHDQVFTDAHGGYLRRSNFNRRTWTPAINGDPEHHQPPILPGMHFHDLRHTHKTWLIEDDIPEIAQAKRLDHRIPGVRGSYSHVTPAMHQRITEALQHRWEATHPQQPAPAGGAYGPPDHRRDAAVPGRSGSAAPGHFSSDQENGSLEPLVILCSQCKEQ
jgi:integrase